MLEFSILSEQDANKFLNEEEGHFFDVTRKDYSGETVQKKCVAFANADGGELLIGIHNATDKDLPGGKFERWGGFRIQEDANDAIADISRNITPSIVSITFEFMEIKGYENHGKVLRVVIEKSPDVHRTACGNVYIRKGAQCLPITGTDITNLQLSKGAQSYENQGVGHYDLPRLIDSVELRNFLDCYLPKTSPKIFLEKQYLIADSGAEAQPIYAGVLLYDENPSVVLPKKCALKVSWYDTNENVPERQNLKDQKSLEGPLHQLIIDGISEVQRIISSLSILGPSGFEKAKYPPEAIKEILVNALIHRDYNISDDVQVFIFNNRIEVHSPGALPASISVENILTDRFSRNPKIVRLLNKYPDRPNHDIGEGLNTAFQKMKEVRLKPPIIKATKTRVVVILPHEPLASPEEQIMQYLETHTEITNLIARGVTSMTSENKVKKCFDRLRDRGLIELVPDKRGANSAWKKKPEALPRPEAVKIDPPRQQKLI
jgi:ATP-dependent DNA helicase RecG